MAQLTIEKTYQDGETPTQLDIDNIIDSIETFLNVTQLASDNIQDASITASTVFSDGSITAGKIAASAVTTAKILDGAVTAGKFQESAITTAKITDANVTTAKIAASTITADNFGANSITPSKLYDDASIGGTRATVSGSNSTTPSYTGSVTPSGLNRYLMVLLDADSIMTSLSYPINPVAVINIAGGIIDSQVLSPTYTSLAASTATLRIHFPACSIRHLYPTFYADQITKVGVYATGAGSGTASINNLASTYVLEIQ